MELLGTYRNQNAIKRRLERAAVLADSAAAADAQTATERPHRQARLPPVELEELAAAYGAGAKLAELATMYDVHPHTVSKALRAAGVKLRYQLLDEEDIERAADQYRDGMSLKAVAEMHGVSANTVLNAFRTAGISTRPVGTNQWR